jgi:hypothetical protein
MKFKVNVDLLKTLAGNNAIVYTKVVPQIN